MFTDSLTVLFTKYKIFTKWNKC